MTDTYQNIARKWRPKNFKELVGQEVVCETLLNSITSDRTAQALLFTGPRGTGKTSTARILSKTLRCQNLKNNVPCEKCSDCTEINIGQSLNVIEIDGASHTGVDAIRSLNDSVGYMPTSGKYKIYIIDEVHMLSTSAFNALLKTLEEPPQHVIFILATTEVQKIPQTILSRCQRFDFRNISSSKIFEQLEKICKTEKVKYTPEALWLIAKQAQGSLRDSQSLLEQTITFCNSQLTEEKITNILGLTSRELIHTTLESLFEQNTEKMINTLESVFYSGNDPHIFIKTLIEEIRNVLVLKLTQNSSSYFIELPESEIEKLKTFSQQRTSEEIHTLFSVALDGSFLISRSEDPKVVLEVLLLKLTSCLSMGAVTEEAQRTPVFTKAATPKSVTPTNRASEVQKTETKKVSHASTQDVVPTKPQTESRKAKPASQKEWAELVQKIKKINVPTGTFLENTFIGHREDKHLTLVISADLAYLKTKFENADKLNKIATLISTFWGSGHSVSLETEETFSEALHQKNPAEERKEEEKKEEEKLKKAVEDHPKVKMAKKIFKNTKVTSIKNSV